MYPLSPLKVYMLERVQDDPRCVARMERMLNAIDYPLDDVVTITDENMPEVVQQLMSLFPPDGAPEAGVRSYMKPLVFTTMDLDEPPRDLADLQERCGEGAAGHVKNIMGQFELVRESHPHDDDNEKNYVCWHTHDFGTMVGCPHGCHYCGQGRSGKYIVVGINNEEYMDKVVGPTIEREPSQKCFRMIGWGADHITFEPENGCIDLFTRKIAEYPGRYGYFHSGSANVDWIADLEHKDRLIGVWSVTCDKVARLVEPGSGPAVERIEAGRKLNDMGVPVRYKFKPIIPVEGWREEYAAIIKEMFARSEPESAGFCVFMWNDLDSMLAKLDEGLLDADYVAKARAAADELKGVRTGPFPHEVRKEIYRFFIREVRKWDEEVLLYISTESHEMWDELTDELGQDPRHYICACSAVAVPGRKLALSKECKYSTYMPTMA